MKRIKLEIDEKYGSLLSLTAVGVSFSGTDVTTVVVDLSKTNRIKINALGHSVPLGFEEGVKTDE